MRTRTRNRNLFRVALALLAVVLSGAVGWTLRAAERAGEPSKSLDQARHDELDALKNWDESLKAAYGIGTVPLLDFEPLYVAQRDAALGVAKNKHERLAALRKYRDQIKQIEQMVEALYVAKQRGGEQQTYWQWRYRVAQADILIAKEEAKP